MITVRRPNGLMNITFNGDVSFVRITQGYANPRPHRDIGPAKISHSGYLQYMRHGLLHRKGGAAVIWQNGRRWYYINGVPYNDDAFFLKYGVL